LACSGAADNAHENESDKHAHNENIVVFTNEQAENILDFSVETLVSRTFYRTLKTSGQILSAPGDEVIVAATMGGIATVSESKLVEGMLVSQGQQLFSISGDKLADNNHILRLNEARIALESAKTEYERDLILVADTIVSLKEFQQAKWAYEQAKLNYNTLSTGISGNGKVVTSPMSGYVKNLLIQSGQYVETGQPMATITHNRRLVLRADVSQRYLPIIKNVQTAAFATPYDGTVYDLADLNGKLLSFGKSSDGNSFYTPVSFEFDNRGNMIEGAFVEVYLKSQPVADALALPVSALIEEHGRFFVFVQQEDDDDEYLKTEVSVGDSDGQNRQILKGLKAGQKVVTKGAYALKLASMRGFAPEHSHEH
jgi:RND family efflux transporter MFP subunit